MGVWEDFKGLRDAVFGKASNETNEITCTEEINHHEFYQYCLIPAFLIILAYSATKRRKNLLVNLLDGRPGVIFPMDSLTRSSRLSYSCAFGATSTLVSKIVMDGVLAIQYEGHQAVKSFIQILSMLIYGVVFFPVFSSLALGSVFSYGLGAAYVWMLAAVEIYRQTKCHNNIGTTNWWLTVLQSLPMTLCLLFLSVSLPFRIVKAFRKGRYFYWGDSAMVENSIHTIRASYAGHHVTKLFNKPVFKTQPVGRWEKVRFILHALVKRLFYTRKRGFRYPARVLSMMVVSFIVLYMLTINILLTFPLMLGNMEDDVEKISHDYVGQDWYIGFEMAINFFYILKVCLIVCTVFAAFLALLNLLRTLSTFRQNLFALYRGDHSQLPPATENSNRNHCVNSIKFAGFQVGYMIWGFVIQILVLWLIFSIIGCLIWLILHTEWFAEWALEKFNRLWPILMMTVIVMVVMNLLAKFVFLQGQGQFLALDNRSWYFNFTYFMFFYNIFLGIFSCLLRILKSLVLGILFLGRLDHSTLARRFEFFDPGFSAYMGALHTEVAHTHPVLITFVRLMMLGLHDKLERSVSLDQLKPNGHEVHMEGHMEGHMGGHIGGHMNAPLAKEEHEVELTFFNKHADAEGNNFVAVSEVVKADVVGGEERRRRRVAARFNWHVAYTLLHNPDIRVLRKGYLQLLRQAKALGVHIPVSDRLADVDTDKLHDEIDAARLRIANPAHKPPKENTKDDTIV